MLLQAADLEPELYAAHVAGLAARLPEVQRMALAAGEEGCVRGVWMQPRCMHACSAHTKFGCLACMQLLLHSAAATAA